LGDRIGQESYQESGEKSPARNTIASAQGETRNWIACAADDPRAQGETRGRAGADRRIAGVGRYGFSAQHLARSIAYIKRYGATGALIVLDVDRLKPINDRFGHAAGDAVLKGVVAVLMRHVRSSDVVGRLGGDEFGLLLWNLTEDSALGKAKALEDAIDQLTFVFKGHAVSAGASAGVALLGPLNEAAAVLEQADRAMYERKKLRRGSAPQTNIRR
jgi:diguanylate cyclase (GGDEF)-like protein